MQKVFITGGAGYIGSVLSHYLLSEGYEVTVIDSLIYGDANLFHLGHLKHFTFIKGDCRDEKLIIPLLKGMDVVIPLAAIVGAPACQQDKISARTVNIDALKMICDALEENQKLIYPTTNSGYGTKSGEIYCTEDTPLEPVSFYGQTKVEAENYVLQRKNSISLRLATVFGLSPRLRIDLLVNHFTYSALTDGYLILFEKDFKRNYVHIRDVAACFQHCIENFASMKGKVFNVGLDEANLSKEALALKIKEHIPRLHIEFSEVRSDPDRRNYIVSNRKLSKHGFEAKITLDEGIEELIKGFGMLGRSRHMNV